MTTSEVQPRRAASSQSPIVAHPWFPKMIGLWFAALFGLCSLALAPELLERIVSTLGIDRIVPAAAPPLGQTARLLLALGMAGVGEIAGLLIGARLAAPKRADPVRRRGLKSATSEAEDSDAPQLRGRDRHPDAPARKPLSAISDFGDDLASNIASDSDEAPRGIDSALRRRARASEAEQEPRPFIEAAPLPGGEWQPAVAGAQDAPHEAHAATPPQTTHDPVWAGQSEAFDLAPFDVKIDAHSAPLAAPLAVPTDTFVAALAHDESVLALAGPAPAEIATSSLEELGVVQLSERLALALQARRERRAQPPVALALLATPTFEPPVNVVVDEPEFAEPHASAPLVDVPLPEPSVAHDVPEDVLAAPALAIEYPSAPFAARPLFAPLSADDADEEHDIPALARSLALPRLGRNALAEPDANPAPVAPELERGLEILARRAPKPAAAPDTAFAGAETPDEGGDADELTDEVLEEGYSSLLAMGLGFHRPEAVRIEEPQSDEIEPVVIFPGQGARTVPDASRPSLDSLANAPFARAGMAAAADAPKPGEPANQADSDETDRALRAALASLQRISGAR